ncbi:MAG: PEP-CTERM sorting domain-containing protein [Phycisphaeraceae bacterium]|nr:PEP-CTERM sorting domain-containing protein [Phycisphaeraceae bacterium]
MNLMAAGLFMSNVASASLVTIDQYTFDLSQFDGATVTYRADGSVGFDGKLWDNEAGVDLYTLGELAAGQYGSDPGDQVSLNDRVTPDWLQLNYATPVTITASTHYLVIYEISSYTYVDPEGLSFQIKVNGGSLVAASTADASNFDIGGSAEDINQLVFDLFDLGFTPGQTVSTVYIENIDSGSGTSDPDFIFAGVAVPEPASVCLLGLGGLTLLKRWRRA